MIFLTVGTQLPFDRMVRAIDAWAGTTHRRDIFAQIGPSKYRPEHLQWRDFIDAQEFRKRVTDSDVVIAHAGMGSIITALELGKTILVMPRRASLGEHRNEHQMATAQHFKAQGRIHVAENETDLLSQLATLTASQLNSHHSPLSIPSPSHLSKTASPQLLETLRKFIS